MAVEETFGLELPDEECEKMITPQLLADYVVSQLDLADDERCRSQVAFYLLRKELIKHLGCQRNEIKLDTALLELGGHDTWRSFWKEMWARLCVKEFYSLRFVRPVWLERTLQFGTAAVSAGLCYYVAILYTVIAPLILWGLLLWFFWWLTTPCARLLPHKIKTVRDLMHYARGTSLIKWQKDDVYQEIKSIILDQLGLAENVFRWDAKFIEDYGCD